MIRRLGRTPHPDTWLETRAAVALATAVFAGCQTVAAPHAPPPPTSATTAARKSATAAAPTQVVPSTGGVAMGSEIAVAKPAPPSAAQDGEPAVRVPARVRKAVDWQAAAHHPGLTVALPSALQQALTKAQLPLLLPDRGAFYPTAIATAEADWYTVTATWDGITVVVQGDRVATVDPEMAPAGWTAPTWSAPLVTRNEGIVEATWLAFGASYVVSIECASPLLDPRCTEDAAVLEWLGSLRRWSATGGAL